MIKVSFGLFAYSWFIFMYVWLLIDIDIDGDVDKDGDVNIVYPNSLYFMYISFTNLSIGFMVLFQSEFLQLQ